MLIQNSLDQDFIISIVFQTHVPFHIKRLTGGNWSNKDPQDGVFSLLTMFNLLRDNIPLLYLRISKETPQ